jgi:hypothetical protein
MELSNRGEISVTVSRKCSGERDHPPQKFYKVMACSTRSDAGFEIQSRLVSAWTF